MNLRLLLMLAAGAAFLWSTRRWREGVRVALLLVIFEGAIRKWVFPGAQDLIYFAKDVFLLGAYVGFFRQRHRLRWRPPAAPLLWGSLVFAVGFGLLQVANPNLPNLLVGILGFKAYFFYVPLLFLLPEMYRGDEELARDLRRYLLLALPVGALALAQFFSPASSPLNTYARVDDPAAAYVATFGTSTFVRVTATFSFITGYTTYLLAMAILILAWLGGTRWKLRGNLPIYAALGATLLGMLMTGSRGPVLLLILLLPLYWWLGVLREQGGGGTFGRLVLGMSIVLGILAWVGQDAIGAFWGRALGSQDVPARLASPVEAPLRLLPEAGLIGFGIGATHQTATVVTPGIPPYIWLRGLMIETESGRIMLELGVLGFTAIYLVRLYLIVFAFRQVRRLRTRFHRALTVASFLFLLGVLPSGYVFDVTSGIYYWFFAGLVLLAQRLDQEAAARTAAAAHAAAPPQAAALRPLPAAPRAG